MSESTETKKLSDFGTMAQRTLISRAATKLRTGLAELTGQRDQLAKRIAASRTAVIEVERVLSLCDRAEESIEKELAALIAEEIPHDGANGSLMIEGEYQYREALIELRNDLPAIRAHWEKKQRALGFVPTPRASRAPNRAASATPPEAA